MGKHSILVLVAIGVLLAAAAPAESQQLVFSDGFGSGDLWAWDRFTDGTPVVGGSNFPGLPPGSSDWPDYSWINVQGTGNTIRNNLTTRNLSGGDHNLEIQSGETGLYFVDWNGLDLHLAPGSPAIDTGSADGATSHDLDGVHRDSQPDVGAYEATDG